MTIKATTPPEERGHAEIVGTLPALIRVLPRNGPPAIRSPRPFVVLPSSFQNVFLNSISIFSYWVFLLLLFLFSFPPRFLGDHSTHYLVAKIGFDTAENEPLQGYCYIDQILIRRPARCS